MYSFQNWISSDNNSVRLYGFRLTVQSYVVLILQSVSIQFTVKSCYSMWLLVCLLQSFVKMCKSCEANPQSEYYSLFSSAGQACRVCFTSPSLLLVVLYQDSLHLSITYVSDMTWRWWKIMCCMSGVESPVALLLLLLPCFVLYPRDSVSSTQ